MPTSIHIPPKLLAAVDRKAKLLKVSRNRLIVRALEREVTDTTEWSPDFFDGLRAIDPADARAFAEAMKRVESRRSSKGAPKL